MTDGLRDERAEAGVVSVTAGARAHRAHAARALRPDAADPAVRERDPPALPAAARCTARRTSTPARRRSRSASARRSPTATGSPAPTAATATPGRRAPTRRRSSAEMLGRATGVCGGRAGSMNVVDLEHGMVGCFGIVGGVDRRRHRRRAVGASGPATSPSRSSATAPPTRRYFHECLNFAAVARAARGVRVREQPLRRVHADAAGHRGRRHRRAARDAYAMPAAVVDGNDLWAVADAAREAVDRARGGGGPTLLEMQHLPPLRPLEVRPGDVPARRRRSSAGWSATRSSSRARGCSSLA